MERYLLTNIELLEHVLKTLSASLVLQVIILSFVILTLLRRK